MEITIHSTEDLKKLAQQIAKKVKPKSVIALYGELGSGKTTFTRFLVESLGIEARVQSPTFVILREYTHKMEKAGKTAIKNGIVKVNHLDLYRVFSKNEVLDLGFEEMIRENNAITVIEWPELIEKLLPENTIKIYMKETGENERLIQIYE